MLRNLLLLLIIFNFNNSYAASNRIFVSNEYGNSVTVIDAKSNTVIKNISVGTRPRGIGLSPDKTELYVAVSVDNQIAVIDTQSLQVVRKFKHPFYEKIIKRSKKYHAHDEKNKFKEGEKVSVEEICRVVERAYNVENNNCTMIDYSNELARKSNELKAADNFLYPMFDIALAVIVLNIIKKQGGSDEDKEKMNVLISSSMKKLFSGE